MAPLRQAFGGEQGQAQQRAARLRDGVVGGDVRGPVPARDVAGAGLHRGDQPLHPGLRMRLRGRGGARLRPQRRVEAWQHHQARGQPRHREQQPRHRGDAARGAGRDHVMVGRRVAPGGLLGAQQGDLAGAGVHLAALREQRRPHARHDREEPGRHLPVLGEAHLHRVRQRLGEVDLGAVRLVEQPRQLGGQGPGAVGGARRPVAAVEPEDQPRQDREAMHRLDRRRQGQRAGERERRLVERAQRHDPRQQQRPAAGLAQERVGQRPRRAPCGQQHQGARQGQRVVAGAGQAVLRQSVEERQRRRDRREAGTRRGGGPRRGGGLGGGGGLRRK